MARRLGAKETWLAAVRMELPEEGRRTDASFDGLEPGWLAALRFAELMADSGHAVTDDVYAELAAHWSEGEIVEIALVIGIFSYFNRFNDALRVEVTR